MELGKEIEMKGTTIFRDDDYSNLNQVLGIKNRRKVLKECRTELSQLKQCMEWFRKNDGEELRFFLSESVHKYLQDRHREILHKLGTARHPHPDEITEEVWDRKFSEQMWRDYELEWRT